MKDPSYAEHVWRHFVRDEGIGWSTFFLDSAGHLAIVSYAGTFGYHWKAPGSCMRRFVLSCPTDYLVSKFLWDDRSVFLADESVRRVRQHILRMRRSRQWGPSRAAHEWECVSDYLIGRDSSDLWWAETGLSVEDVLFNQDEELLVYAPQRLDSLSEFLETTWPKYLDLLRKDLAVEDQKAP